jgi:hypothetical protein
MKKKFSWVPAILVNKRLKVSVYVVPVIVKNVPYDVVTACMN